MPKALGLIETRGLVAAIEAADAMVKAANVKIVGKEQTNPALITIKIVGDVVALAVLRRGLAGDPDRYSARRDHARRKRARQLKRRFLHVLGGLCSRCEQHGEQYGDGAIHLAAGLLGGTEAAVGQHCVIKRAVG